MDKFRLQIKYKTLVTEAMLHHNSIESINGITVYGTQLESLQLQIKRLRPATFLEEMKQYDFETIFKESWQQLEEHRTKVKI